MDNVNRYIVEPVDFIHILDTNSGRIFRTMGHRVRDLETSEYTPGTMLLDDALELILHMNYTDDMDEIGHLDF